jgi:hypothetical protein
VDTAKGRGEVPQEFVAWFNLGSYSLEFKRRRLDMLSFLRGMLSDQTFYPSLLAYKRLRNGSLWGIAIRDGTELNQLKCNPLAVPSCVWFSLA